MSPIEVEQINICMHLCKYLSKNRIIKISVNFSLTPMPCITLGQSHHQATVTLLNMGDFISVFPLVDYLGDSLPIEEVG